MTKFRDGMLGPTIILLAISFLITFALAGTYDTTAPIIAQGEIAAADQARREVLPSGDSFSEITGAALPEGVTAAYQADNGEGFVFTSQAKGFSGDVVYMIGIASNGDTVGIKMFQHNETPGLGTKIAEPEYIEKYLGNVSPDSVDAVTGATRTTNSLKNSLKLAIEAYQLVKEA